MKIDLPYGHTRLNADLPSDPGQVTIVEPHRSNIDPVCLALAAPMDSPRLRELVHPRQKIVIITSDITRPCPSHLLLPPLMDELASAGVQDDDVTVIFGLGSHRKHTKEEQETLVGRAMAARLHCIDSDPEKVVLVGTTSRGTPVEIFEPVVKADVRIVLGNVEPHYFAGYSGGAKAIVPGVSSVKTIRANHAHMVERYARSGIIDDNPVRLDLEEGAAMVGIDFMLNVVLDSEKRIVVAAAGDPTTAHRWLCKVVDAVSMNPVKERADIVIVSAGGYPKDINMYQAHKALDSAAAAVKPGGQIIWVAACTEGVGNKVFEEWMLGVAPEKILARFKQGFVLGGHKAASIARVLQQAKILLVSDLPDDMVRKCSLEPYPDLESAVQAAIQRSRKDARIMVIPEGASVILKVN